MNRATHENNGAGMGARGNHVVAFPHVLERRTPRAGESDTAASAAPEMCREILQSLLELHCTEDATAFPSAGLCLLQRLLPSFFVAFHEIDLPTGRRRHACIPIRHAAISERILSLLPRSSSDEPVITPARVSKEQKTARKSGIDDVLAIRFQPSPSIEVTFLLARRSATFSAADCNLAEQLRPHFIRAYEVAARSGERRSSLAVTEDDPATASGLLRQRFGLTRRQSELLYWLARGKSNREMAIIFGISARTVDKHLEHVFEKLDVQSRHAAVVQALEAIGSA